MEQSVNILGAHLSRMTMEETMQKAIGFLQDTSGTTHKIYTPNPEIIYEAYHNEDYREVLNRSDFLIPDGIGVVYASRILKRPMPERVAGYDLVMNLFGYLDQEGKSVYILGGKPGVAEDARDEMKKQFPNLSFCGVHDGYFKEDAPVIEEINAKNPDLLLVCLGYPKQEKWIDTYANQLSARLAIGAGGSVDVMAGTAKRAPEFFIKHNLEWFYRLLKQPSRIGRMMRLPKFLITVILHGKKFTKGEK